MDERVQKRRDEKHGRMKAGRDKATDRYEAGGTKERWEVKRNKRKWEKETKRKKRDAMAVPLKYDSQKEREQKKT